MKIPPRSSLLRRKDKHTPPELGVEVATSSRIPDWIDHVPPHESLKRRYDDTRPHIENKSGRKLLFLGFDRTVPWEHAEAVGDTLELKRYACVDRYGRHVEVEPQPLYSPCYDLIQARPVFHYNLNTILANPDVPPILDNSKNIKALLHQEDGVVLNYIKFDYVASLGGPQCIANDYKNEATVVAVKYGDDGENVVLNSTVYKGIVGREKFLASLRQGDSDPASSVTVNMHKRAK